jgi:hypothetical protein
MPKHSYQLAFQTYQAELPGSEWFGRCLWSIGRETRKGRRGGGLSIERSKAAKIVSTTDNINDADSNSTD